MSRPAWVLPAVGVVAVVGAAAWSSTPRELEPGGRTYLCGSPAPLPPEGVVYDDGDVTIEGAIVEARPLRVDVDAPGAAQGLFELRYRYVPPETPSGWPTVVVRDRYGRYPMAIEAYPPRATPRLLDLRYRHGRLAIRLDTTFTALRVTAGRGADRTVGLVPVVGLYELGGVILPDAVLDRGPVDMVAIFRDGSEHHVDGFPRPLVSAGALRRAADARRARRRGVVVLVALAVVVVVAVRCALAATPAADGLPRARLRRKRRYAATRA